MSLLGSLFTSLISSLTLLCLCSSSEIFVWVLSSSMSALSHLIVGLCALFWCVLCNPAPCCNAWLQYICMCVCMLVCVYVYMCYVYIVLFVRMCIRVCVCVVYILYMYACTYVCAMYILYMYVCTYVYLGCVYVYMYIRMYVSTIGFISKCSLSIPSMLCVYVHMYVCTHVYLCCVYVRKDSWSNYC
jgi:hypothetical protein